MRTAHLVFDKVRAQSVALFRIRAILAGQEPAEGKDLLTIGINLPNQAMKVLSRPA